MPQLRLHNSLSGKKEDFQAIDPGHVRVYACGPTVYNYAHIGNARMAVVFDVLVRLLRQLYPKVTYVSNITDVDDKIMNAARETGEDISAITRKYTRIYNEDMGSLGVLPPDVQPLATEHIGEMITLMEQLVKRDHAYAAEGHVLFHVPSFPKYGALSGRSRDDQIAGARVEVAPYKKDPADFVMWKPSDAGQPGWDSPWGRGRPGWHIECSAMTEKHLGLPFDIHGGGADLKFPHHENEIAQSCCAHGHENDLSAFAKYWVHNGFLTVEGEKMSKSLGNFRTAHELIEQYPGEQLRMTLLSGHYRAPLDWTEAALGQSKTLLDRVYRVLMDMKDIAAIEQPVPDNFFDALCDDLNTAKAFTILGELARDAAAAKDDAEKSLYKGCLLAIGNLVGLFQNDPAEWLGYGVSDHADVVSIERLLQDRQLAKAEKNFARADEIRRQLDSQGIVIEDTPAGPKWRKK